MTQLVKARETQPSNPETLYLLGRVHMKLSLAAYEKLKELDPDNYRIYQLLGENYEVQGLHGPALTNYNKALERNPQARGISIKVGDLLAAAGETAQAVAAYRRETQINPSDSFGHFKLGTALLDQGSTAEACSILRRAVTLDETSISATRSLRALFDRPRPDSGSNQSSSRR